MVEMVKLVLQFKVIGHQCKKGKEWSASDIWSNKDGTLDKLYVLLLNVVHI